MMIDDEFLELLCFPEELKQRVKAAEKAVPFPSIKNELGELLSPEKSEMAGADILELLDSDPDGMKILSVHLAAAQRTRALYEERGIGEDVFKATFGCFLRFLGETKRNTGRTAFDRAWWTVRQLSLRLFRLGTLEYEIGGDLYVHIHIPSDADLSGEAVDRSLAQAAAFFKAHFPAVNCGRFYCKSWLLSPNLDCVLPTTSKISAFRRRFVLEEFYPNDESFGWWVFGTEDLEHERLPARTALQKNLLAFLKDGHMLGAAMGYLLKR